MIKPVLCVCVFVCHPNVCESPGPKIEKEALNEWHRWTFLPSASASSCPRCHGPPFKAGPFEYWRDNPPLSIMKLPSEGVHSLSVHLSRSPPPLPSLPLMPTLFSFLLWNRSTTCRYQADSVIATALCLGGFGSALWVSSSHAKIFVLFANTRVSNHFRLNFRAKLSKVALSSVFTAPK